MDFDDGFDRIDLTAFNFGGPGQVVATATQSGTSVIFDLGNETVVVVLDSTIADFGRTDFIL